MAFRRCFTACALLLSMATSGPALAGSFIPFGAEADAPAGFMEMCERQKSICSTTGERNAPDAQPIVAAQPPERDLSAYFWSSSLAFAGDYDPGKFNSLSNEMSDAVSEEFVSSEVPAFETDKQETNSAPALSERELEKMVRSVNRQVNGNVRQMSDLQIFGTAEYWQAAGEDRGAFGDCEDIALQKHETLLARGFPSDRLFLAVVFRTGVGLHTVLVARMADGDVVMDSVVQSVKPWEKVTYSWLRVQSPDRPLKWSRVNLS